MHELEHQPGRRRSVRVGGSTAIAIGGDRFAIIAGPCSVESRDGLERIARGVGSAGAVMLRGGAWKPRTSPHSFQGMGDEGLALLRDARAATGLPIVTEVLDPRDVQRAASVVDMLQIGARNMSNTVLLREVAQAGVPVLLKRGFGATIDELLDAADYVFAAGNEDVVLVERGIRTFERSTRFTLDIGAVPVLRTRTHLPIIVDPSHAAGDARFVPALARAAVAVGADGLLVEVHDAPDTALSDGDQALTIDAFGDLVSDIDRLLQALDRERAVLPSCAVPG